MAPPRAVFRRPAGGAERMPRRRNGGRNGAPGRGARLARQPGYQSVHLVMPGGHGPPRLGMTRALRRVACLGCLPGSGRVGTRLPCQDVCPCTPFYGGSAGRESPGRDGFVISIDPPLSHSWAARSRAWPAPGPRRAGRGQRAEGEYRPAALLGQPAQRPVRVHRVRVAHRLQHRQVGDRVAVGVAVGQPVPAFRGQLPDPLAPWPRRRRRTPSARCSSPRRSPSGWRSPGRRRAGPRSGRPSPAPRCSR